MREKIVAIMVLIRFALLPNQWQQSTISEAKKRHNGYISCKDDDTLQKTNRNERRSFLAAIL